MPKKGRRAFDRAQREGIDKISALAERFIGIVTALIALVFVGISVKEIPWGAALRNANPDYVRDLLLSIYILCWALGAKRDTYIQKSVYLIDPLGGRIRTGSIIAVAALAAVSITLLLVRTNELYFSLALAAFTSADISTWLYLRYIFLPPIIEATQSRYEEDRDCFGLIKLDFVKKQILGDWKWRRQVAITAVVVCMIVSALVPPVKYGIAAMLVRLSSALSFSVDTSVMLSLVQDFLLLLFVTISEVWHWLFRLRTYWTVRVVSDLEDGFTIRPRATT
jgi:hypothetical protein